MAHTTYTILTGTWYDDNGYVQALAPSHLEIAIRDGRAYDEELRGLPDGEITIDHNGHLACWAAATFQPDAGEIERVGGRAVFGRA